MAGAHELPTRSRKVRKRTLVAAVVLLAYEGNYIQGVIAAKMSKTGVLGYVSSFPIPEVISGLNTTMLGAQTSIPTSGSRSSG